MRTINTETKVAVAAEFIKNADVKNDDVAKKFGISVRSVTRYKKDFAEAAQKYIDELEAKVNKIKLSKIEKTFESKIVVNKKGRNPKRNGRWNIIFAAVEKLGIDAESSDLYIEINKMSIENGLHALKRSSVYAMLSSLRKSQK